MMVADAGIFQNQVYADPLGAGLRGYGLGNMVFQQREQKRQEEEARQRAEQGAQQYQADISSLMTNPNATAQDYVQLSLKYPQAAKVIGDSWNLVEKNQRQAVFDDGMRAYSAAKSGKPELAAQIFQQRADAYRANGNEGAAEQSQFWADAITNNPTEAINMAGIYLSGYDPEKFTENFGKIQAEGRADALAPIKLRQEEAAATTAEATAGVAPQIAQIDLNTKIAEFDKKRFDADSAPERYQLDVPEIIGCEATAPGGRLKLKTGLPVNDA
jgi:hypothetical protein